MSVIEWLSDGQATIPLGVAVAAAGVAALLESALALAVFVPAASVVLVAAAGQRSAADVVLLILVVAVARVLGDLVAFRRGALSRPAANADAGAQGGRISPTGSDPALEARFGAATVRAAADSLDRHGVFAELLTRLVPTSRSLVPTLAGARGVPVARFVGASAAASLAWSALWVAVGVLARASFPAADPYLHVSGWAIVAVLVALGVAYLVGRALILRTPAGSLRRLLGDASFAGITEHPTGSTSLRERLFHEDEWRTLPNLISAVRILLLPVFGVLLFVGAYWASIVTLLVVFLTDFADGFIARRFDQQSQLGAWLDPMADRLTVVFVVAAFAVSGIVPWELVLILLIPDILSGVWAAAAFHGAPDVRVSKVGKVRTALLFVGLFMMLFGEAIDAFHAALVGVGFALFVLGVVGHYLAMTRNARGLVTLWLGLGVAVPAASEKLRAQQ